MNNEESNMKNKARYWWLFSNMNSFCTLSIPSSRARRRKEKIPFRALFFHAIANKTVILFTYFGDKRFSNFWSHARYIDI